MTENSVSKMSFRFEILAKDKDGLAQMVLRMWQS
jgi:hypothetical protein